MSDLKDFFIKGDKVLENKFKIIKILGKGTFGQVYLVEDEFGKEYALKVLFRKELDKNYQAKIQLLKEVNILKKVKNKNICSFHEIFEEDRTFYFM